MLTVKKKKISAVEVNPHNYRGKHLLLHVLFTKGWTLTNVVGQFTPKMHVTECIMGAKSCSVEVYANDLVDSFAGSYSPLGKASDQY